VSGPWGGSLQWSPPIPSHLFPAQLICGSSSGWSQWSYCGHEWEGHVISRQQPGQRKQAGVVVRYNLGVRLSWFC
jgi:hypothetical protein